MSFILSQNSHLFHFVVISICDDVLFAISTLLHCPCKVSDIYLTTFCYLILLIFFLTTDCNIFTKESFHITNFNDQCRSIFIHILFKLLQIKNFVKWVLMWCHQKIKKCFIVIFIRILVIDKPGNKMMCYLWQLIMNLINLFIIHIFLRCDAVLVEQKHLMQISKLDFIISMHYILGIECFII